MNKSEVLINTILILLWAAFIGCCAASALTGNQPSWVSVFLPAICLVFELFSNYFK